jgi:hypothetical protein
LYLFENKELIAKQDPKRVDLPKSWLDKLEAPLISTP